MKAIIQRVKKAHVEIDNKIYSNINEGLLVLLGIAPDDQKEDADWLIKKIANMRIFSDENHKMNLSVIEANGNILVVSQFTLFASTKKGNRPSFTNAASPSIAIPLYEYFLEKISILTDKKIASGIFGADMQVSLINDGPITIVIDSKDKR